MRTLIPPRTACLLDAIGCALGGILILILPSIWTWLALPDTWRVPTAALLLAFASLAAAASQFGSRYLVSATALGNVAWVIAGAYALTVTDSLTGGVIIAIVMIADAVMAWLQFFDTST